MGVRFLVLLIALVPLASSRDLRTASTVNRRTAPDPLLVQLFNDPTATSQLTKKLLDGSDDGSASGSGLWAASGDGPKASDDTTAKTVTKPNPVKLANDDATVWANSGSGSGALPATKTEDETVETKDDSVANVDVNAKKSSFIPSETQTVTDQVEEGNNVRDSTAAPKGDANDMYDATVVKKNEVPKPDDATATGKSVVVHTPEGGLLPLTSDQSAQQQSQDLSQMTAQPQQDMAQAAAQPLQDMSQAAAQPLQDMSQAAVQPQQVSPQPDMSQYAMQPQQDMPQDAQQQDAAPPQMMAPNMANSTLYQGAPLQSNDQGYGQYQDPSQAGAYTQDSNQDPSMDQPSVQGQAAVNPYASQDYFGNQLDPQTGLPIAGMQQVPVFKGLKAKKIDIKEDECEDMYDACPDMAKNKYCTKFSDLMHVQCKKSCGFCQVKDEASGDSGSGSAMWNDLPQEDNEIPIWRKSGIPSPGDKVVAGESGSGSAIAADAWSNSASGENMIKGEADAVADDEPAPAEKNESAVADTLESSGSGQQSTSEEFGSGANLAEDLATGTVSKAEQDTSETKETNESEETTEPKSKYSEIPGAPQVIIQQQPAAEVYPHIDLKTIAKAVDAYKSTALRMLGEAIRDSAQEAENKAAKRTSIPMPPANDLLKKMGFPMDQPRSQMRELEYPFAPYWQTMAAQQEAAAARAKIAKAKEDARKKAKAEAEAKAKKLKEDQEASGDLDDPYMYVRHMPKGASMQPIESHPGASNTPHGHSNPIILFKNSQISNAVAAKKNAIPKPSVSKFLMQQMPQAAPAARSGVEQPMFNPMETAPSNDFIQDSNLEMPANSTQGYVQQGPLGDNQIMNSFNADSQAALVQPQPQGSDDANLRELSSYFPGNKKKRSVKGKGH